MYMEKKIFFVIIILFLVFSKTNAQENLEKKRNEIGFNLINCSNITVPSDPMTQRFNVDFINGIYFKQHFEKHSLRVAFDHFSGNVKINGNNTLGDTLNTLGNWSQNFLSAGFEKNLFDKKNIQLYWGVDLNLYYGIYNGQSHSISGFTNYSIVKQDKGLGITPLGGARYTISKFIRFSLEANASSIVFSQDIDKHERLPTINDKQNQDLIFVLKYNITCKLSYLF
jgi:hypothetical protein